MSQRDFIGYGRHKPDFRWPGGAGLAIVVVLNFEEGAEPSIPDGDPATELALTDAIMGEVPAGTRDLVAESLFEYGSRAGFWRLADLFAELDLPPTVSACAQALARNPDAAALIAEAGWDVCAHGDRFMRHFLMDEAQERAAIANAVSGITRAIGRPPTGWQSRYAPSVRTRALIAEHECLIYDADSYADDLPFWHAGRLIVPHSFTLNDNRLATAKLPTAEDFRAYLASAFTTLLRESRSSPRLMTISLHNRVSGQPARFDALRGFLADIRATEGVWFAGRADVARHFAGACPPPPAA